MTTHPPTPEQQLIIDAAVNTSDKPSRLIPLTQGLFATIDAEDYDMLMAINTKWFAHKCRRTFYAETKVNGVAVKMHRVIMNAPKYREVDHKDHDGLNNRKKNLSVVTQGENKQNKQVYLNNKSGVPGVYMRKLKRGKQFWRAQFTRNGVQHFLGNFYTKEEAIKARLEAERDASTNA